MKTNAIFAAVILVWGITGCSTIQRITSQRDDVNHADAIHYMSTHVNGVTMEQAEKLWFDHMVTGNPTSAQISVMQVHYENVLRDRRVLREKVQAGDFSDIHRDTINLQTSNRSFIHTALKYTGGL